MKAADGGLVAEGVVESLVVVSPKSWFECLAALI